MGSWVNLDLLMLLEKDVALRLESAYPTTLSGIFFCIVQIHLKADIVLRCTFSWLHGGIVYTRVPAIDTSLNCCVYWCFLAVELCCKFQQFCSSSSVCPSWIWVPMNTGWSYSSISLKMKHKLSYLSLSESYSNKPNYPRSWAVICPRW